MTIVHFLKKIKPDICYMNCKKNSFQVWKMAHTAVLWLFQVFFIILKWLIHILKKKEKKKRKFWPVLNFTYGIHICKTTNITGHGFFFLQYFEFFAICIFLMFALRTLEIITCVWPVTFQCLYSVHICHKLSVWTHSKD